MGESLELPLRHRNQLLLAAGYSPAYPETGLQDSALQPVMDTLRHILHGHLPYPAIVIDNAGGLVAANDALAVLTDGTSPELLRPPVNVYRVALHPAGMAPRARNHAQWASTRHRGLRAELGHSGDHRLQALLGELESYVPAQPDPIGTDSLGFAVPIELVCPEDTLRLITTITTFATAIDVTLAELRLEAFLPADDTTAALLGHVNRTASGYTGDPARPS